MANCPCPKHPFGCIGHPINCGCAKRKADAEQALADIWKIVHTPTKLTRHRSADDHFQADFDNIRKIIVGSGVDVGGALKP